jgi:PTS system sucrose-specific IIC component
VIPSIAENADGKVMALILASLVLNHTAKQAPPIEAGLLGNPSIGVNFLLPIWAMANVAQGGACFAVWPVRR